MCCCQIWQNPETLPSVREICIFLNSCCSLSPDSQHFPSSYMLEILSLFIQMKALAVIMGRKSLLKLNIYTLAKFLTGAVPLNFTEQCQFTAKCLNLGYPRKILKIAVQLSRLSEYSSETEILYIFMHVSAPCISTSI